MYALPAVSFEGAYFCSRVTILLCNLINKIVYRGANSSASFDTKGNKDIALGVDVISPFLIFSLAPASEDWRTLTAIRYIFHQDTYYISYEIITANDAN